MNTRRQADLAMLDRILAPHNQPEMSQSEYEAFVEMRSILLSSGRHVLSRKQRLWAEDADKRLRALPASEVPRGREVPIPEVLRVLPLRPPHRRHEVS